MKLLPKVLADVVPIIRWTIEVRLQLIAEVACGLQASGTIAPGKEQAMKRILWSLGTDWKAEEAAIVNYLRAEVREWWQDFPERQLLTGLYRRAALRWAGCGSPYNRRRPDSSGRPPGLPRHCWPTSRTPAGLTPSGSPQPFRKFWQPSCCPQSAYAPQARCESTSSAPKPAGPTSALSSAWRRSWTAGARSSPARSTCGGRRLPEGSGGVPPGRSGPPQRPVNPAHLLRYVQIQFTIAVLQRVGVKPTGNVSGCRIVSEALELSEGNVSLSEDSVRRIWDRPFVPEFQKYSKAIATRNGPFHTTKDH